VKNKNLLTPAQNLVDYLEELQEFYQICKPYSTGEKWIVAYSRPLVCSTFDDAGNGVTVQAHLALKGLVEILLRLDLSGVPTDEETDRLKALLPASQSCESSLVPTSERLYIASNNILAGCRIPLSNMILSAYSKVSQNHIFSDLFRMVTFY
jgi:hypothetical protein